MLFPAPLWVLGPPSPRAPTPLGAPGGTLAPINPPTPHLHPPLLETHVSQGVGVGPPLQPVPHRLSHTPIAARLLLGLGKGDVAAPRAAAFHTPPDPSPALLPQQRWGNTEEAGAGGYTSVRQLTASCSSRSCPVSRGLSGSRPAAPAVLLGDKVGTITAGTEPGPSVAGGVRTEPPLPRCRHGQDAGGTHRLQQARRPSRPSCLCLPAASCRWWWGGLAAWGQKTGRTPPEPPTFWQGGGRSRSLAGDMVALESALQCHLVAPTHPPQEPGAASRGMGLVEGGCSPQLRGCRGHGGTVNLEGRAESWSLAPA